MNFTQTENQTSPLLSLPVEIICSIFHWACSEPSPFTTSGLGESSRTEIALSHVCHQWRSISLAHPVLWTLYCGYIQPGKIASSTEYSSSKAKKFSFEELDAYLERSSQLPLDLWLDFSDPDRIDYPELALDMITDAKHAARWRRVSLRLHEEWALENLLDPLRKVAAPLLQSFEVDIITAPITGSTRTPVGFFWEDDDDMPVPMDVQVHNPFLGGTRLTHVRIDARVFKSFAPCLANVTTLYIEGRRTYTAACSWSTFLSLIASPCLTSLSLFGLIFHPPSANTIPLLDDGERKALVRTNLKHLRTMDPIVAKYMWFYLDAPSSCSYSPTCLSLLSPRILPPLLPPTQGPTVTSHLDHSPLSKYSPSSWFTPPKSPCHSSPSSHLLLNRLRISLLSMGLILQAFIGV